MCGCINYSWIAVERIAQSKIKLGMESKTLAAATASVSYFLQNIFVAMTIFQVTYKTFCVKTFYPSPQNLEPWNCILQIAINLQYNHLNNTCKYKFPSSMDMISTVVDQTLLFSVRTWLLCLLSTLAWGAFPFTPRLLFWCVLYTLIRPWQHDSARF